jgi:hypothetical protein
VPYTEELPVPERSESWNLEDEAEMNSDEREMDADDMDCYTEYVLPNSEKNKLNQSSIK